MINLIIKGNMFDAFNASHARGIALISAAQQFREGPFSDVVASCADTHLDAVRTWFLASDGPAPYPAGALLFYSDKPDAAPAPIARPGRPFPTEAESAAWRREHGE
jgi:hypothetical protein